MAISLLARSLNQRSHTSVITIEHLDTFVQIAINGQPLNRVIVYHLLAAKINSNSLWLLLENFLRLSCFFRTSMDSILLLIHPNKDSCKRKVPHPGLPFGRKMTPSDYITFLPCCLCVCCFMFSILCQSSFYAFFLSTSFVFCFVSTKKGKKIRKIQKQCVFVHIGTCVLWMAFEAKFLNFVSLVAQMSISMHNLAM